jgi:hypothetical protein
VERAQAPSAALLADQTRSRQELLAENAFSRQQLVVAARRVKRAHLRASLAKDVIDLIRTMATANRFWGAERIRGALLKLG